jgi:hypothetical protein
VKRPNQAHFGVTLSSKNLFFSKNLALLWPRFINRLFINLLSSVQGPQRSCKKDLKSEKTQSSLLFFSPGCTMHIQSIILALYLNAAHTVTIFCLILSKNYSRFLPSKAWSVYQCTVKLRAVKVNKFQNENGHCVCSIKIKC